MKIIRSIKEIGCLGSIVALVIVCAVFGSVLFSVFSILTSLIWNVRYDEEFWGIFGGALLASCLILAVISFFWCAAYLNYCKWMDKVKKSWQFTVMILLSLTVSIAVYAATFGVTYNSCCRSEVLVKTPVYDFYEYRDYCEDKSYRKIFYPDGTRYEGTGKTRSRGSVWRKDGEGTFYKTNGEYRTETWEDDVLISYGKWQKTEKGPNF